MDSQEDKNQNKKAQPVIFEAVTDQPAQFKNDSARIEDLLLKNREFSSKCCECICSPSLRECCKAFYCPCLFIYSTEKKLSNEEKGTGFISLIHRTILNFLEHFAKPNEKQKRMVLYPVVCVVQDLLD